MIVDFSKFDEFKISLKQSSRVGSLILAIIRALGSKPLLSSELYKFAKELSQN